MAKKTSPNQMIGSIKNTLDDLLLFLKEPKDQQDSNQTINYKRKKFFSIFVIDILFALILILIIACLEHFSLIDMESHKSKELLQLPTIVVLLVGAFIIPFVEELIFRSYLRLKHNYFLQPLISISSITGRKNKEQFETSIENNWTKFYKSIFYISALIFAFVHLSNFEDINEILLFIPILIAPQFIVGLLAGYLRVKFSLIWGFFLHGLHNFIFIGFALISLNSTLKKVSVSNEKFNLQIEEVNDGGLNTKSSTFISDSVYFDNFKLKTLIAQLVEKNEKYIEFSSRKLEKQRIKLTFKKHLDSIDSKKVIFNELQKAYAFSMTKNTILDEVYNIEIKDSISLINHKQNIENNSKFYVSKKELKLENINLSQLTTILNSNYKQSFFFEGYSSDKYSFQFEKPKFVNLENVLYHKYGLVLETNERELEYLKIDFEK